MPNRAASALIAMAVVQAPVPDAAPILMRARLALGGDARIAAVKTFMITGRTRQVQGDNLVPIEFEIACELPAKCIRRDEIPARKSGATTIGYSGVYSSLFFGRPTAVVNPRKVGIGMTFQFRT